MTSPKEIEHYQTQIKTLLDAKKRRLDELKEINDRLAVMGVSKHTPDKPKTVSSKPSTDKSTSSKTVSSKPTTSKHTDSKPEKGKTVTSKEHTINATVKNMKLFLDFRGIPYGSHATRSEIEQIIRKHNLVRKVVNFQKA